MFYATNRSEVKRGRSQSITFSDREAASALAYGVATVRIPPIHKPGSLERPAIYRLEFSEDQEKHIIIKTVEALSSADVFYSRLNTALDSSAGEAFLFVHGYNVEFDDAVRRTAQLFHDLKFSGAPILFSWPAQDAWWRYLSAEDQVLSSAIRLRELLRDIIDRSRPTSISIIAHSVGIVSLRQPLMA